MQLAASAAALACLLAAPGDKRAWAAPAPPAGIPSAYVWTHHGWFHSSCVIRVGEDERIDADRVIRGRDGKARRIIGHCGYPRYDRQGRPLPGSDVAPAALPAHVYDGYIGRYGYDGTVGVGPKVVTEWTVPPSPAKVTTQDIAFFNDILTTAGGGDILQPVLDFNSGRWTIESEHCCINGNDMQTTGVTVAPGDTVRGTVSGTGCTSSGCQSWAVTTEDVTSGKSTTLNTTAPGGVPNGIGAASLESYDITSCDMLPGGGRTTFTGHTVTDVNGAPLNYTYRLALLNGVDAELPRNCGYAGTASGNDYTLIYGAVPDGGVPDAGGKTDAGATDGARDATGTDAARDAGAVDGAAGQGGRGGGQGGSGGSAGKGGGGGGAGASGAGGRGTAGSVGTAGSGGATGAGGSQGTGGGSGMGGTSSTGGALGTGGISGRGGAVGSGGVSGTGGAATAGASGSGGGPGVTGSAGAAGSAPGATGAAGGGCGCEIAASRPGTAIWSFALLVLWAGVRSRRRAART